MSFRLGVKYGNRTHVIRFTDEPHFQLRAKSPCISYFIGIRTRIDRFKVCYATNCIIKYYVYCRIGRTRTFSLLRPKQARNQFCHYSIYCIKKAFLLRKAYMLDITIVYFIHTKYFRKVLNYVAEDVEYFCLNFS